MKMIPKYDYLFDLILIGDSGVGKSWLLERYMDDQFTSDQSYKCTPGMDLQTKTIKLEGKIIKLRIWDTAGLERNHSIASSFYKKADGIFVVYDVTNKKSFDNVYKWFQDIEEKTSKDVTKFLVGNKCDLVTKKVVDCVIGKKRADCFKASFLETSSKTGRNVEQAFVQMASLIKNRMGPGTAVTSNQQPNVNINGNHIQNKELNCIC